MCVGANSQAFPNACLKLERSMNTRWVVLHFQMGIYPRSRCVLDHTTILPPHHHIPALLPAPIRPKDTEV